MLVDASVCVKWLYAEPHDEPALELLDSHTTLMAPELILLEVAGAISRRSREGHVRPELADAVYARWSRIIERRAIELYPIAPIIDRAFALSVEVRHPLPDCVYLACAEALGVPVMTADRAMQERGRRASLDIRLLQAAA